MAIIKILPRHTPSYGNLINYILKVDKNEKPQLFTHNLHSNNPKEAMQEFLQNESFRTNTRSDQVYLYHEIISFSNEDTKNITPEMLQDLAHTYVQLRGNEGVYLGSVHQDKAHTHIHFCTSGTKLYTGKAMRLARDDLLQLKVSFQQYHQKKYPEIKRSNPDHGKRKSYTNNKEYFKTQRNAMKTEIEKKVNEILEQAQSQKEFLDALRAYDLHYYERKAGELTGIVFEDTKFRFARLDVDVDKIKALPQDITEEQKALQQIQDIRDQRQEKHQGRILQFEEHGIEKTVSYNMEMKTESWRDANGKSQDIESELTANEYLEFERVNQVMEEYPDRFDQDEPVVDTNELDVIDLDNDPNESPEVDTEMDDEPEPEMDDEIDNDDDFDR